MPLTVWQLDPAQITPYYNIALCDALANAGCNVRYICSRYLYDKDLPFTGTFQTDYLYFRGLGHPALLHAPRLRQLLRGINYPFNHGELLRQMQYSPPDVVHIQWSRLPYFDTIFIKRVRAIGVPVVHTVHNLISGFASSSMVKALENIYAQADRLILHAEANKRDLLALYPNLDADRMRVIPHIAFNPMRPANVNRDIARQRLNLPTDTFVVGFFGSIRRYKGVDILLQAFRLIHSTQPQIRLIIAGKPENPADVELLEIARSQSGIMVYSGYIPYEDVWIYHLASDIQVLPYRQITQSGALITAMEMGCPVIVTDVGALPESIDGNGWIVPSENPEALATAILEAAANPGQLAPMGERSRELLWQRHAPEIVAQKTIAVYQELVDVP